MEGRASFGILGPLDVRVSNVAIDINAAQLRRVLCILLLAPGRPVAASTVLECMWPGEGAVTSRPDDPAKTVRTYVSRLRGLLPREVGPRTDVRGYRLEVASEDVDAGRFEALLRAATPRGLDDPVRRAATLGTALELWRGAALEDCRDEPWAVAAAVRLEELRIVALERLTDARLELGEHPALCGELEVLVGEHPLRERFWAQLMLALYRSGRQTDALRAYGRLRRLLRDELGITPSRELAGLEAAILRHDMSLDPPVDAASGWAGPSEEWRRVAAVPEPPAHDVGRAAAAARNWHGSDLPARLTSFVGRSRELAEVNALVRHSRLVTLTGAGGVGKTRLALEVADGLVPSFTDTVAMVDLAASPRDGDVSSPVAAALGIKATPTSPAIDAILAALGSENILVLLDNCEHVAESSALLCGALLRSCRGVSVIATSRQSLDVEGEAVYVVPPLALPPDDPDRDLEATGSRDAVRLFVERARSQSPAFKLDDSNASLVETICRRLDGIPLALELAAARMRVLSLAEIRDRLDERFLLLRRDATGERARQSTLEAAIDWSYDLLQPAEAHLFRRLGAFSGGFSLDEVCAIGSAASVEVQRDWGVLDCVDSLVHKSLVLADTSGDIARYSLLETIRQYALAKLLEVEGIETVSATMDAHARAYLDLAERAAPSLLKSGQSVWLRRLELDIENLRRSFNHLLGPGDCTRGAMRLLVALGRFFDWGHESDLAVFARALDGRPELDGMDSLAIEVELVRQKLAGRSDPDAATGKLTQLLAPARTLGDAPLEARLLNRLAWLAWATGEHDRSETMHAEAVAVARAAGDHQTLGVVLTGGGASEEDCLEALEWFESTGNALALYVVLCNLAGAALDAGDADRARALSERATALLERDLPGFVDPTLLVNLGTALVLSGDHEAALPHYRRAIGTARRRLHQRQLGYGLIGVALCSSREGDLVTAATLHGAASQQFERWGFVPEDAEQRMLVEDEAGARSSLGPVKYEAAVARGREMSVDDVVDLALGRPGPYVSARLHGPGDTIGP